MGLMNTPFDIKKVKKNLSLKKFFKEDDTRFILTCAFKISAVSIFVAGLIYYLIFIFLSFNNIFFEAHGFPVDTELQQAFFDSILTRSLSRMQYFFIYVIVLFWVGIYVGIILLRPFKNIAHYCDVVIDKPDQDYNPDAFSDFRLLTRFSEFFFQYLLDARKKGSLGVNSIPPQYQKIHKPVFDKVFFFHFFLIIICIAIASSYFIMMTADDIYDGTINLALKTLKLQSNSVTYFLQNQQPIFDSLTIVTLVTIFISYISLAAHLYGKVSGPAFGFFTTMRAFMKGKYYSRVHLLGYNHIRPYSRKFNKYLDYVMKEIAVEDEKISK